MREWHDSWTGPTVEPSPSNQVRAAHVLVLEAISVRQPDPLQPREAWWLSDRMCQHYRTSCSVPSGWAQAPLPNLLQTSDAPLAAKDSADEVLAPSLRLYGLTLSRRRFSNAETVMRAKELLGIGDFVKSRL